MTISFLIFALLSGVASSIPTGPIGVLIISSTLNRSMRSGLRLLLGLVVVEICYLLLFYYGFDRILTSNQLLMTLFLLVGSLFLIFLGFSEFKKERQAPQQLKTNEFTTALVMSVTNPGIFLIIAAVIASARNLFTSEFVTHHLLLLLALFELGAVIWFLFLIFALGKMRSRVGKKFLQWSQRIGAGILIGFGLYNLAALLLHS